MININYKSINYKVIKEKLKTIKYPIFKHDDIYLRTGPVRVR